LSVPKYQCALELGLELAEIPYVFSQTCFQASVVDSSNKYVVLLSTDLEH